MKKEKVSFARKYTFKYFDLPIEESMAPGITVVVSSMDHYSGKIIADSIWIDVKRKFKNQVIPQLYS